MSTSYVKPSVPSDDVRWRIVQATMRRHGFAGNSVIETLHKVQEAFGFLDPESLKIVATSLRLPLSKVYGVATFYHFFTLKPPGLHNCVVCMGTACYIKGAPDILNAVQEDRHIGPGETTSDGALSLLTARCLGACGLAPAVVFDGEVAGKVTPAETIDRVHKWNQS